LATGTSDDCWSYWYPKKGETIEPEIPRLEELLVETKRVEEARILDVGCGTGRHVIYFARRGFDVYGFDKSPLAIQSVAEDLKRQNISAHLLVHDMTQEFPYQNEYFDAVLSTRVIGHALSDQVKRISREIDRVLKRNGYLYLQVPLHEWEMKSIQRIGGPDKVKFVDSLTHIPYEGPEKMIPHHHFTKEHLEELFPNYGMLDLHQSTDHYNGICLIGKKSDRRTEYPD
jgi:SAM-dependent methyltransferase